MSQLTLADLIVHRVPLAPREAATLTLAVAREWDRQRALQGPILLPDAAAIRLHSNGDVSFLIALPAAGQDDAAALSALLGQLLAIDEPRIPRQRVPGGLLVTMAGRLGPMELPSTTADGFRAALARFADNDPATLSTVFWRAAGASPRPVADRRENRSLARRSPDRRQVPETVTELRRTVRQFEQQLFESQRRRGSAARLKAVALTRVQAGSTWALAACALALMTLAFNAAAQRPRAVHTPVSQVAPAAVEQPHTQPPSPVVASHRPKSTSTAAAGPLSRPRVENRRRLEPRTERMSRRAPAPTFAGGTRTIAWLGTR